MASCAPTRYVVPLTKKEKSISVSFGGPIIEERGYITPAPFLSFTYAKGKTKSLTYFGGLQLSSLFDGFFAVEAGALKEWKWWSKKKIGFTTNFVANAMTDGIDGGFTFFPQFDANLYWHFMSDPHYFCDCPGDPKWNMFLFTGFQSHYNVVSDFDLKTPFNSDFLFSPHLGLSIGPGASRLAAEVKWIQPWVDNTLHNPQIWNPFMETGTFGGFISFYHNF
ncbi:MAG: hypothetical protein CMP63_02410 [Flavobacteriales bacterium]|nr:hypothetical protein [Flavobacteriales bacterium]|tara:strand:- start:839 stop:1504 length:666 start_codon:yes stop_codon:yes gene_type:complete